MGYDLSLVCRLFEQYVNASCEKSILTSAADKKHETAVRSSLLLCSREYALQTQSTWTKNETPHSYEYSSLHTCTCTLRLQQYYTLLPFNYSREAYIVDDVARIATSWSRWQNPLILRNTHLLFGLGLTVILIHTHRWRCWCGAHIHRWVRLLPAASLV